jgi:hypothetical protein
MIGLQAVSGGEAIKCGSSIDTIVTPLRPILQKREPIVDSKREAVYASPTSDKILYRKTSRVGFTVIAARRVRSFGAR